MNIVEQKQAEFDAGVAKGYREGVEAVAKRLGVRASLEGRYKHTHCAKVLREERDKLRALAGGREEEGTNG